MHDQKQLEFWIADGKVETWILMRPCEKFGKCLISPLIDINDEPGSVFLSKMLGLHCLLQSFEY